jgi:hypothetical protein
VRRHIRSWCFYFFTALKTRSSRVVEFVSAQRVSTRWCRSAGADWIACSRQETAQVFEQAADAAVKRVSAVELYMRQHRAPPKPVAEGRQAKRRVPKRAVKEAAVKPQAKLAPQPPQPPVRPPILIPFSENGIVNNRPYSGPIVVREDAGAARAGGRLATAIRAMVEHGQYCLSIRLFPVHRSSFLESR